jgi:RNA polymerase sigma-32 factor
MATLLPRDASWTERMTDDNATASKQVPAKLGSLPVPKGGTKGKSTKDLLNFYLAEVRKYPLLTPEEEKGYALRYQESGDQEAAERLVTSNLRLVIKIAFQYHRQWANVLDLIQEGNVGLVEALSRYDPSREIRFSSYAQYWIRAMILRFLLDNFRLVRLGGSRAGRKLFFQLQKERDRLVRAGIDPSAKRIAENLGVSEKEVHAVDQHMRAPALSLHAPAGDADDGRALAEVVPEKDPNDPEDNAARTELSGMVQEQLAAFAAEHLRDEREEVIWQERMIANDPVSLAALGERFGVSKERIRQVEARMKKRLKAYLEENLGDEIDFEFS